MLFIKDEKELLVEYEYATDAPKYIVYRESGWSHQCCVAVVRRVFGGRRSSDGENSEFEPTKQNAFPEEWVDNPPEGLDYLSEDRYFAIFRTEQRAREIVHQLLVEDARKSLDSAYNYYYACTGCGDDGYGDMECDLAGSHLFTKLVEAKKLYGEDLAETIEDICQKAHINISELQKQEEE